MPRKDRTFNERDILRIVRKNLTVQEQRSVIIALCTGLVVEEIKGEFVIVPLASLNEELEEAGIIDFVVDILAAILIKL